MTVAATANRELNISSIVTNSFRLVGLLNEQQTLSDEDGELGRTFLGTLIDYLQTEGLFARSVRFADVSLTAGTHRYQRPDTTLDVVGDGMYIAAGTADLTEASGETLVRQIRREEWHQLSSKDASGRPTLFYVYRASSILELRFWPIPDEDGFVRIQEHRLLADNKDGNATPDLQRYWVEWMMWALGHKLAMAKSLPLDRVMYANAQAEKLLQKCKGQAFQRGSVQMYVSHRTQWSR